jgi:hypothetical protein
MQALSKKAIPSTVLTRQAINKLRCDHLMTNFWLLDADLTDVIHHRGTAGFWILDFRLVNADFTTETRRTQRKRVNDGRRD